MTEKVKVTLSIDKELWDKFKERVFKETRSMRATSGKVEQALIGYLKKK